MVAHLSTWQRKLHVPGEDPLRKLRAALSPVTAPSTATSTSPARKSRASRSTYLGEVL
jgi:hypothetical protein